RRGFADPDADRLAALPRAAARDRRSLAADAAPDLAAPDGALDGDALVERRQRLAHRDDARNLRRGIRLVRPVVAPGRPAASPPHRAALRARAPALTSSTHVLDRARFGSAGRGALRALLEQEALPIASVAAWIVLLALAMPALLVQDSFLALVDG